MATEITENELIAALLAADISGDDKGALTTVDLCKKIGKRHGIVLKKLGELKAEDKIEVVWVFRENLAGEMRRVPAYRWKK